MFPLDLDPVVIDQLYNCSWGARNDALVLFSSTSHEIAILSGQAVHIFIQVDFID